LTDAGGRLYYVADDRFHGLELWQSDGTAAGTRLVQDLKPGPDSSRAGELTLASNRLYFTADDGVTGADEHDDVKADVENLRGTPGDDVLTGNARSNVIDGGAGNDDIAGGVAGTCALEVRQEGRGYGTVQAAPDDAPDAAVRVVA
jgi:ELWxxDGT repeat protein